jgi:hypothetical protein
MNLLDLKHFQSFHDNRYVKVLRHYDSKRDLWDLFRKGKFKRYQDSQSWDVFGKATHIISFIAERHKYAKFIGVFEVTNKKQKPTGRGYLYTTKQLLGFEDLSERLIVKWGDGTRSWAQWLHRQGGNKVINEIVPPNYVMEFPGYYNFSLPYEKLSTMISNPESNREWQRMLSAVSGVYLILDSKSGKQYIGSAYSRGGIWARWTSYVRNPSGGNSLLEQLLSKNLQRFHHFQFSILRVLEPSSTKEKVLFQEKQTKFKLGSRAFGLNLN